MPKRPCAVTLTSDESTLLCADKFGDVYALPLLGQPYESSSLEGDDSALGKVREEISEPFVPSASSSTVHTKRNRDALRQQQNMIKKKPQKKPVDFDHQLILGHVSLLTDVLCATKRSPTGSARNYILTADRDEHIRVSRGLPQAHIIEGFCLGHRQFISKLCLVPSHPQLLVSGGGDEFLLLWDWSKGQIKYQIDLKAQVEKFRDSSIVDGRICRRDSVSRPCEAYNHSANPISVSTLHCMIGRDSQNETDNLLIVVSIEG